MKNVAFLLMIILMTACIPDGIKNEMDKGLANAQEMMADWQFKNALSQIELHKLRNGEYPKTIAELKFLTAMDSSMLHHVEYTRLDSGYQLDLKEMEVPSFGGESMKKITLKYPPEFWVGLGCVKSNLK